MSFRYSTNSAEMSFLPTDSRMELIIPEISAIPPPEDEAVPFK